MRYDLVIFDWDGTLMNSEARIVSSIQYAANACGLPVLPYDVSKQIIGLSLDKAITALYPDLPPGLVVDVSKQYTQHFLEESQVPMQPYVGAEAMLQGLSVGGVRLAVATGKSRQGLDAVLKQTGYAPYFDITRTPVESASKPDPLMLQQILDELAVDVTRALMVGDTTFDMLMAQNIGMDRVALSHGVHDLHQLMPFDPVATFDDLIALHDWLLTEV